ncbi:outer membrane lipoprotein carrier protein LolA [Parvibaculum sp.]|uniref:outer membrane lipoprotein carrier protein LolA n=1 Tax=Parvibaculum sp. TaxID=2024848 RepID=UPI002731F89B|nr:outer membrane lipoprotein carrier protein LolA [Parvibaculum sp.]MDP1627317.1 outer membrane lipoprotein carrier protein LolA [Parvibaculum sp.]MDP2151972.1 outer membrane lipoprotein carrier protein LolA [Parvibaculum sp.]MDP3327934.1 outer membrane lipoprotein carrier protein LolA [Parvibaculum sp.]
MKRFAVLFLTLLSFTAPARAASCPMPEEIREEKVTRGFTQERHIEGMSRPLKSAGVLHAEEGRIVWHMLKPFDVETVITASGITEAVDGGAPQPVSAGPADMGAGIARSAAALMRGQWTELETIFNASSPVILENGDWEILLTPLQARMKSAIGSISVRGCEDVARVEIGGAGGDRQVIEFVPADDAS